MPLVEARQVSKSFAKRGGVLNRVVATNYALEKVSFSIERGETVGVVGESGCGKSTLGKTLLRLHDPTNGRILFDGTDITDLGHRDLMPFRRRMQIIFQDPYSSLNPRQTVRAMLAEACRFHGVVAPSEMDGYLADLIAKVGLAADAGDRFPHEFSGGQRQRIGIARALSLRPDFIVADEPVSALDVSVQAQVLNLMADLRQEFGLTVLFISHDLKVVEHFSSRVLVMYLGHVVEELGCNELATAAKHPYTLALLAANPVDDPAERRELTVLAGDVPSPFSPPAGCPFVGRCPIREPRCLSDRPTLVEKGPGHRVACWAA